MDQVPSYVPTRNLEKAFNHKGKENFVVLHYSISVKNNGLFSLFTRVILIFRKCLFKSAWVGWPICRRPAQITEIDILRISPVNKENNPLFFITSKVGPDFG